MKKLNELTKLGQAVWLDNIRRNESSQPDDQESCRAGVRPFQRDFRRRPLDEGVAAFAKPFDNLMNSIEEKRNWLTGSN